MHPIFILFHKFGLTLVLVQLSRYFTALVLHSLYKVLVLDSHFQTCNGFCVQPQEFNKQLRCAVCLAQFKEPKILPCLHTYCKECLAKLLKKKGPDHVITHPECRQDVKVS